MINTSLPLETTALLPTCRDIPPGYQFIGARKLALALSQRVLVANRAAAVSIDSGRSGASGWALVLEIRARGPVVN